MKRMRLFTYLLYPILILGTESASIISLSLIRVDPSAHDSPLPLIAVCQYR